jgi:hypothetical protein
MFADGRRLDRRLLLTTRSPGVLAYCWPIGATLSEYGFGQDVNARVCFGLLADICAAKSHVCFTPESGHSDQRQLVDRPSAFL